MGRSVYNWVVVFEDGSTDLVKAEDVIEALELTKNDYCEVIAVVKGQVMRKQFMEEKIKELPHDRKCCCGTCKYFSKITGHFGHTFCKHDVHCGDIVPDYTVCDYYEKRQGD